MNDEQMLVELGSKLLPSEIRLLVSKIKQDAYVQGVRDAAEAVCKSDEEKIAHNMVWMSRQAVLSILTTPNEKKEGKE